MLRCFVLDGPFNVAVRFVVSARHARAAANIEGAARDKACFTLVSRRLVREISCCMTFALFLAILEREREGLLLLCDDGSGFCAWATNKNPTSTRRWWESVCGSANWGRVRVGEPQQEPNEHPPTLEIRGQECESESGLC